MIDREVRYIVISDIHLGHKKNHTKDIIANLALFFNNFEPRTDLLDIIFIAGDLFDNLLDLSTSQVSDIVVWISKIMKYCLYNKIKLRILEGTPSHDWMQSSMFDTIAKIADYTALNYKYVKTLSVEIIPDYNLSILYVPDEWNVDVADTYKEVLDILKNNALTQVDIAIMHGQFCYQLPEIINSKIKHIETNYLNITKHFITIGHVHQFTTFGRILAQGSFDRLSHGDESPKGGLYIKIRPDMEDEFLFIDNKLAKTFLTVRIPDKAFATIFEYLDNKLAKIKPDSYIRLKSKKKNDLSTIYDSIVRRYPAYNFTKDINKKEDIGIILNTEVSMSKYEPIIITESNIKPLILDRIISKYSESDYNMSTLDTELTAVL